MRRSILWMAGFSLILLAMCQAGYSDDSEPNGIVGATSVSSHMLDGIEAADLTYVAAVDQIAVCGKTRGGKEPPHGVEIRLFSSKDMALVSQTKIQRQDGIGLSNSSSGKTLVADCLKGLVCTFYVYDCTPSGLSLVRQKDLGNDLIFAIPHTHTDAKCVIAFLEDGGTVLQAVDVLDDKMPRAVDTEWDYRALFPAVVSHQGTRIAIGRHWRGKAEFTLGIWELSGKQLRVATLPDAGSVSAVGFSPDGSAVVTGTSVGKVHVWKVTNDSSITEREFKLPTSYAGRKISDVRFSSDSRIVTASVGMHRIVGWETNTAKIRFVIYHEFLNGYTWLDRQDAIATVNGDSELKVWKLSSGDDVQIK